MTAPTPEQIQGHLDREVVARLGVPTTDRVFQNAVAVYVTSGWAYVQDDTGVWLLVPRTSLRGGKR